MHMFIYIDTHVNLKVALSELYLLNTYTVELFFYTKNTAKSSHRNLIFLTIHEDYISIYLFILHEVV